MRSRFTGLDILCVVKELQPLLGMRVNQVYDIDSKTYLIKFDKKVVLLIESGKRIHITQYDWPKNIAPSGFSMKLRKHLNNKRVTNLKQLGFDRIVDLQFGSGEVAFHLILEIFNRGNLILTDHQMRIVSILSPHSEGETRFAVRELYPIDRALEKITLNFEKLKSIVDEGTSGDLLKKLLLNHIGYGIPFIEHILLVIGVSVNHKIGQPLNDDKLKEMESAIKFTLEELQDPNSKKGFIIIHEETDTDGKTINHYEDFSPFLFKQYENKTYETLDSFNESIDEYFSQLEYQKQEMKTIEHEKEAFRKVDKIKEDQASRLEDLKVRQLENRQKAELIMSNADLVDQAIRIIRLGIASQMSWSEINNRLSEAKHQGDPVASSISKLKLSVNTISMVLQDKYAESDEELVPLEVDIDLNASAHVNAKSYFNNKKLAALKEQKTLDSQNKAIKSAEKKAREVVKDIKTQASISKSRKVLWFEKFYWCISSENYLIIGGKDQKQNEMIVKKYMGPGDLYVHADIHGASSIIVKNPSGESVPPKTLNEAGLMAVCYSVGWESKILCSAWWVHSHQVSKTPPSGEYLTMGSFMIRGQKNYLLPIQLQMGFSFLFRIEESSLFRHVDERKVKITEELSSGKASPEISLAEPSEVGQNQIETELQSESISQDINDTHDDSDKEFPDTDLMLHFDVKCDLSDDSYVNDEVDEDVKIDVQGKRSNRPQVQIKTDHKTPSESSEKKKNSQNRLKRGQKGRQKKIKEKYKDQDEEDKELRMAILKPAGPPSNEKKLKRKGTKENQGKNMQQKKLTSNLKIIPVQPVSVEDMPPSGEFFDEDDDVDDKCEVSKEDVDLINLLTGQPSPEDDILYAIPLVAPYSAILNYKYKVKLTPGATKRGKAARTAAEYFVRLKECSVRERDTIKSVKDDSLYRNLPGKVKVVIPQSKKK